MTNDLYSSTDLEGKHYETSFDEQGHLRAALDKRTDTEAGRMKRYLAMPDLSRTETSPISQIVDTVRALPTFKKFDNIVTPEIVPAAESFDLFNFPLEHPARSKSDTYYVDDKNILRTHTTVMWYYYFGLPEVREKLKAGKVCGAVSYGKVFRKDEIDRRHMNIFHQIDGLYVCPKSFHQITQEDLKDVLSEVVRGVFGEKIKYRFNPDTFPYTFDSLEVEVDLHSAHADYGEASKNEKEPAWVEVLGAGIVQPEVLRKLNVDPEIYNGWAFGFGLERLAIISMELPDIRLLWSNEERVKKQLRMGQKFVEVSKFPPIVRDISFVVTNKFVPNNYFDLVRDIAPDMVEEVELLDKYENAEKFGPDHVSYAYRVTYRSLERTLTVDEVNSLHKKLEQVTTETYGAKIR